MGNLLSMKLKCLIRDKENLIWAVLFPLFLATVFHLAFSNLGDLGSFETIEIATVSGQASYEEGLMEVLEQAYYDEEQSEPLFHVKKCSEEEAKQLIEEDEITAYIIMGEKPEMVVKESSTGSTIVKSVLDSYLQTVNIVTNVVSQNPEANMEEIIADASQSASFLIDQRTEDAEVDPFLIYFYALLAYACIYGSFWGFKEGIDISASYSSKGARIQVSPYSKPKMLLCNLLACFLIELVAIALVLVYMAFIINVSFGPHFPLVALTCVVGVLVGILLGALVAIVFKGKEKTKESILTAITLGGGFLSGLMVENMKYFVANNAPILKYINPVHLLSDCFSCLYYYEDLDKFLYNFSALLITAVVYTGILILKARGIRYADR